MKVTVLLRNDHDAVKSLFAKYQKLGTRGQNGKKELFDVIRRELLLHTQMEEEIFYPALAATSSKNAASLVSSALREHQSVEKVLQELSRMSAENGEFETKMTYLIDEVSSHIEKEEEEIFDEARKTLPEYRLEELGLEIEGRKKILGLLAA